jgi:hypothetical protein
MPRSLECPLLPEADIRRRAVDDGFVPRSAEQRLRQHSTVFERFPLIL